MTLKSCCSCDQVSENVKLLLSMNKLKYAPQNCREIVTHLSFWTCTSREEESMWENVKGNFRAFKSPHMSCLFFFVLLFYCASCKYLVGGQIVFDYLISASNGYILQYQQKGAKHKCNKGQPFGRNTNSGLVWFA